MSTAPRTPEYESARGSASIGKSVTIKGQIFSREDLTIDGEVEGTVECQEHRLTVGPNGKVKASVKAREVVVLGTIQEDGLDFAIGVRATKPGRHPINGYFRVGYIHGTDEFAMVSLRLIANVNGTE